MTKVSQAVLLVAAIAFCFSSVAHCDDFEVQGVVYCDTCRAGFVTRVSQYLPGAKVRLQCRERNDTRLTYSVDAKTDNNGLYTISADGEHEDEVCEVVLKSSPRPDCNEIIKGRNTGRVAMTSNNGIQSGVRYANALGFLKDKPLSVCGRVIADLGLTPKDIMVK